MGLQVNIDKGKRPSPQTVSAKTVVQRARASGNPKAEKALAVTIPTCRIDQTGLQYQQRRQGKQTQFQFKKGVLRLSLRQSIYIANNISKRERSVWEQHEQDHVLDYQTLMNNMEREIKRHPKLKNIFATPQWHSRRSFNAVQNTIKTTVDEIFKNLVKEAVRKRDTDAEYAKVRRKIKNKNSSSK